MTNNRDEIDRWLEREITPLMPRAGSLNLAVSELEVPAMPEARIVVYTPRDGDTRARMPLTRRAEAPVPVAG